MLYAAVCAPYEIVGQLMHVDLRVSVVIRPPASCTKRSAAARSQSRLFGAVKVPSIAPVATRARRNASDGILGTVAMRGSMAARLSSRRLAPENVAPAN